MSKFKNPLWVQFTLVIGLLISGCNSVDLEPAPPLPSPASIQQPSQTPSPLPTVTPSPTLP
ncbi:hypothetical protein BECAL_00983, partial [Bellilinea caldifistulae]